MKTDIHIIGIGGVGGALYNNLLRCLDDISEIENVYGYKVGAKETKETSEKAEQSPIKGPIAAAQIANRADRAISREQRKQLEDRQKTEIVRYSSLDDLVEELRNRITKERRSIIVVTKRYKDICDILTKKDKDEKRFRTTFLTGNDDLKNIEERVKKDYEEIQKIAEQYRGISFELYTAIKKREGVLWNNNVENNVKSLISKRTKEIVDACIGISELGKALRNLGDLVIVLTNPVDITTYIYAAGSQRNPETVFSPVDNDRRRYEKALEYILGFLPEKVVSVGPHDHSSMLIAEWFQGDMRVLNVTKGKKDYFPNLEMKVNDVAHGYIENFGRLPTDTDDVVFDAVKAAVQNNEVNKVPKSKIILWHPDEQMYVGWMAKANNGEVIPADYTEVFPPNTNELTLEKFRSANQAVSCFINGLINIGFIQEIKDESKIFLNKILDEAAATQGACITILDREAEKQKIPAAGEYIVTTYYKDNKLYLALMQREEGLFRVERLLSLGENLTPRRIVYDSETRQLYYANRYGIDAVHIETDDITNVLRIKELVSKEVTGVTSLCIDRDTILFTVSGKGVGRISKQAEKQNVQWHKLVEYSTQEHIDALTKYHESNLEGYVALCGGGILYWNGNNWKKSELGFEPEALVEVNNTFYVVMQEDGKIKIKSLGMNQDTVNLAIVSGYKLSDSKSREPLNLHKPQQYLRRVKAAAYNGLLLAVHYRGSGIIFDTKSGDVTELSTRIARVRAIHPDKEGFIIAGDGTGFMKMPGMTIDSIYGFGTHENPARCFATIEIK